MTQCQSTGAIVCNGDYVNASNVQDCVTALNGVLTSHISASGVATGSSECDGGQCSAEGTVSGKISCAVGPQERAGSSLAVGAMGALGLIATARRVTRRRARRARG
jgi:hypothetical protein